MLPFVVKEVLAVPGRPAEAPEGFAVQEKEVVEGTACTSKLSI
jgi:hypothetical protein